MQIPQHVVLDYWVLSLCSILGSCQVASNAITKSEDVLVLFVLKRVFVHIHKSLVITQTRVKDQLLRFAWRIDACGEEWLLNGFARVNISEDSNLLVVLILLQFEHFPAKADIDSTLVALIKSNLVGVWELVNFLVRSEVLNASACR